MVVYAAYAAIWHWCWPLYIHRVFLICDCFCAFFFLFLFLQSDTETADRNGQWYQHLLTLFASYYENNTEGTNFRIMFICFTFVKCACFVLYSTCVRFSLVKSPEATLYGSRGSKSSDIKYTFNYISLFFLERLFDSL